MTQMGSHIEKDDIETCAAGWILKRDRGELSAEERAALESWLAADSRHRAAYLRLNEAWQFSAGLRIWRANAGRLDTDVLAVPSARSRSRRHRPLAFAAAATVLVVMIGLTWLWIVERGTTYATQIGGFQRVVLDDGSVLQLNTDTRAQVRYRGNRREVHLLRGEAFFEVAHDRKRPFDVVASGTRVRAVGTAFAVRLREAQKVDVVVTEGRVALRGDGLPRRGDSLHPQSTPPGESTEIQQEDYSLGDGSASSPILSAGEIAEVVPQGFHVSRIEKMELARRLAWQSGELRFEQEPLAAVAAEFNRYNRRRIEIADPALAALEVGGNFKATDLESFLVAMQRALNVRVEETEETIRLFAD
jgi:transmembrane sensor